MANSYHKRSAEDVQAEISKYNKKVMDLAHNWEQNPEEIANYLQFSSQFYSYSPKNQMLIYDQNRYTTFLGSYQFFKEKGWNVKKGEKGLKIFFPVKCSYFYRDGSNTAIQLINATKADKEKIEKGLINLKTVLRFKLGTVFDISQTNCPAEEYPKLYKFGENSKAHSVIYEATKEYIIQQGISVSESDLSSISLRGLYTPDSNSINISDKLKDTQKLSTLFHEFSHALLQHRGVSESLDKYCNEFQADSLTLLFYNRLGLEVTDALKDHLGQNVKFLFDEIKGMDEDIKNEYTLINSLKAVNETFKNHIDDIENHLDYCLNFESDLNYTEQEFEQSL